VFTGIVEHQGTLEALDRARSGGRVTIHSPSLASSLTIANSIAVNGCCLTIVSVEKDRFCADLSAETMAKTSFGVKNGALKNGVRMNLEQPLTAGKEFGGHFVLGHVDATGRVASLAKENRKSGCWTYGVEVPEEFARYIVPKGSITIDGISLTVANWSPRTRIVEIAVIPYTYEHTNIRDRQPGDAVNLEGDVLGKYVERYLETRNAIPASNLTLARLREEGF
jgi:riboflavin synthase